MKKKLLFIATVITLGFASCSEDECDHKIPVPNDLDIAGNWYEEAENEEMRLNENGTFYDKYSNVLRSGETEGRWEYDRANKKLTQTYTFMGQTQFNDWTVKNLTETSLVIYSTTIAEHKLEKIVETYNMKVGGTADIQYSANVTSYTSKNERLASVTSDGKITAEGEKGTTYIKVATDNGNVWVKVVVGEECFDLWYDYVSVIGMDYTNMRNTLNRIGEPVAGSDGYTYGFGHDIHDLIEITKVHLCPEDGSVSEIDLVLKNSVPESKILAYINSRYYKEIESGNFIYYHTKPSRNDSKAMVVYDKENNVVMFYETAHFLQKAHVRDLWHDFTPQFGKDKNTVKDAMLALSYSFYTSNEDYSEDGSDYYDISGDNYAYRVGFVFNPDNLCSEYWVYLNFSVASREIIEHLEDKYFYNEEESEKNDGCLYYYDFGKTTRIKFDQINHAVVYTNLKMRQHEPNKEYFGKYYEGLELTQEQIISKFGTPFSYDENKINYYVGSEYVSIVIFSMNANTGKCRACTVKPNDKQTKETIIEYLSARYTVFKTAEDGSQYAYTNGPTVAESTMGIVYYPDNKIIQYVPLNTASTAKTASASTSNIFK